MNPLSIFSVILPIIEELPSVESGIIALFNAVKAMISGGISAPEVLGAVTQSMPAITAAVVANTPSAPTLGPAPQSGLTAAQLNAQEVAAHQQTGAV